MPAPNHHHHIPIGRHIVLLSSCLRPHPPIYPATQPPLVVFVVVVDTTHSHDTAVHGVTISDLHLPISHLRMISLFVFFLYLHYSRHILPYLMLLLSSPFPLFSPSDQPSIFLDDIT